MFLFVSSSCAIVWIVKLSCGELSLKLTVIGQFVDDSVQNEETVILVRSGRFLGIEDACNLTTFQDEFTQFSRIWRSLLLAIRCMQLQVSSGGGVHLNLWGTEHIIQII